MGKLYNRAVQVMMHHLSKQGEMLIQRAIETRDTGRVTGNQLDAYGYAVYHNGKRLISKPYFWPPQADDAYLYPSNPKDADSAFQRRWGTEDLDRALKSVDSRLSASKGFDLVIVNAVPYTNTLEYIGTKQAKGHRRKWRVITQVYSDLAAVGRAIGHSSVSVIENKKYSNL